MFDKEGRSLGRPFLVDYFMLAATKAAGNAFTAE
jgi:hypothetical protein